MERFLVIFLSSLLLSGIVIAKSYRDIPQQEIFIEGSHALDHEHVSLIDVAGGDLRELIRDQEKVLDFERELGELQKLNYDLEKNLVGMQKYLLSIDRYANQGLAEEVANLEIDPADLEKYATPKLDLAEYEVEDGITYQIDIHDHGRMLCESTNDKTLIESDNSSEEEQEVSKYADF